MEGKFNSRKLSSDFVVFCPDTSSEEGILYDAYPCHKGCFIGSLSPGFEKQNQLLLVSVMTILSFEDSFEV